MKRLALIIFTILSVILTFSCRNNADQKRQAHAADTSTNQNSLNDANVKNILFFGNSLTAGYGLDNQQEAFPALIQQKIDSLDLNYECINAGLSGETSAGGLDRIDWILDKQPIDIFVLELGANDGLRGVQPNATFENLYQIINKVKKANPQVKLVLAGMKVPPSMGENYASEFENIFPKLAKQEKMTLIPFLLENVAGITKLNQNDAIHPTKEGQLILAENVWSKLKPLL